MRLTLDNNGTAYSGATYDPWGSPERGSVGTFGFTGELQQGDNVYLRARWYNANNGTFTSIDPFEGYPQQPYSLHPYQCGYSAPTLFTDPSGRCLGWLWGDPSCEFAGTDYTKYDYAGAGQVVVSGLGVAATVIGCTSTLGVGCAASAAGAAAVTSWGNQALDNAGQPVTQAITNVDPGIILSDAAAAAIGGVVGGGASRIVSGFTNRITSEALRATVQGSVVGATSSGAARLLINIFDSDPNTAVTDGLLESCLFGAAIGGLTGRLTYGVNTWLRQRTADDDFITIFRGVNENHVAYNQALKGTATPNKRWWNIFTRESTPYEHNKVSGGTLHSPYTSWTTNPEVAINYALRPNGSGVVSEISVPRSSLVESPNLKEVLLIQSGEVVSEAEVLLRGVVRGAKTWIVGP